MVVLNAFLTIEYKDMKKKYTYNEGILYKYQILQVTSDGWTLLIHLQNFW